MHFSKISAFAAAFGITAVTAAPAPAELDTAIQRRDLDSKMKDICNDMSYDENRPYYLLIAWTQGGSIDSSGDPEITDEGALYSFDENCDQVDMLGWNGGSGRPGDLKFRTNDDHWISVKMTTPLLSATGRSRISTPHTLKIRNADGENGWHSDIWCDKGFNENTGIMGVTYYRPCQFWAGSEPYSG